MKLVNGKRSQLLGNRVKRALILYFQHHSPPDIRMPAKLCTALRNEIQIIDLYFFFLFVHLDIIIPA